jgi:hypothetical protein
MRQRLLAIVAAAAVAGCSAGSTAPSLSDAAARQLQADALAVTQSAAAHNWPVARTALQTLRSHLAAARTAGTVSAARATSIEAAVAAVSSDIAAASVPSITPTPTTAPPPSASAKPRPTRPNNRGRGKGGGGGDGAGG